MKKLLPKRKPERKPSDEEFAVRKSECPPARGIQPTSPRACAFLVPLLHPADL